MTRNSLEIKGIGKRFGAEDVLKGIDLAVRPGEFLSLVGMSGCGKSTLLRLIAGLERPSTGEIRIGEETPDDLRKRAALSVAFQDAALLPWRTVAGNVALGRSLARRPRDAGAVSELIDLVGLSGFEARRPAELSGGMRQRAAIARAMASAPELLLLDEPFGALDELTRDRLNAELPALWEAHGATSVLVTHSVAEAVRLADRILVLSPRPARIAADITVDLPRPRDGVVLASEAFRETCGQVSAALRDGQPPDRLAAQ